MATHLCLSLVLQAEDSDVVLTVSTSIGLLVRSASFQDGTVMTWLTPKFCSEFVPNLWKAYWASHGPRAFSSDVTVNHATASSPTAANAWHLAYAPTTWPASIKLYSVGTTTANSRSTHTSGSYRQLLVGATLFCIHASFRVSEEGLQGGVPIDQGDFATESSRNIFQPLQLAEEGQPTTTVTFQNLYDVLTPSTSRDKAPTNDPKHLIRFQKDSKLEERQRQQQRSESHAARAPIDLRDKINENKRAREQANEIRNPISSPTHKPEARRVRITKNAYIFWSATAGNGKVLGTMEG